MPKLINYIESLFKMNVTFLGYRGWSYDVLSNLLDVQTDKEWSINHIISTENVDTDYSRIKGVKVDIIKSIDNGKMNSQEVKDLISFYNPNVSIFCGWSWFLDMATLNRSKKNLCTHISPLPKYRGGSPIQHQIINGEKKSAVSVFEMGEGLDDGPIYVQECLSLEGHLEDIFSRIVDSTTKGLIYTLDGLVEDKLIPKEQIESNATFYKRRKKNESEITEEDLKEGYEHLWNKIRALENPYPNAYIKIGDFKLLIKRAEYLNRKLYFTDLEIHDGN